MEAPIRNTYRYLLAYWMPILVYLLIIYIQSSYPSVHTTKGLHLDKLLHLVAYAVLGFLFARAYGATRLRGNVVLIIFLAIVSASLYGVLDELHQYYVPQRRADALDVGADILGSIIGVYVYWQLVLKGRAA